jgi:hypothetical protein
MKSMKVFPDVLRILEHVEMTHGGKGSRVWPR